MSINRGLDRGNQSIILSFLEEDSRGGEWLKNGAYGIISILHAQTQYNTADVVDILWSIIAQKTIKINKTAVNAMGIRGPRLVSVERALTFYSVGIFVFQNRG